MTEMKPLNLRIASKQSSNSKLISSAIKSISEKGINETTMSDVSQGAGLSQGIVNFHFKSKELLLIETLKYVSNEYLESFQASLKKSGSDPRKNIIAIINNDFSKKICSRDKVALWFTFFSEVKFKPAYHQVCKKRDLYYQKITEDIFKELINLEKSKISLTNVSNGLQALVMGLWLDQLEDPDTFKRKKAKEICFDYVKSYFPKQFKDII